MATVHFFLRSPDSGTPVATVYRQVRPYGPYDQQGTPGCSPQWIIEIDPSQDEYATLYAVTDGTIQIWPYRPDVRQAVGLRLTPFIAPALQLQTAHGVTAEVPVAFLYLNVDAAHITDYATSRIQASKNPSNLSLEDRLDAFMSGIDTIDIKAGDAIGKAAPAPFPAPGDNWSPGDTWLHVEFQVETWEGNHLDPAFFYSLIQNYTGPGSPLLTPADQKNSILSLTTPRILLEIRTEYNTPYQGDIRLTDGDSRALAVTVPEEYMGHIELPLGWSQYELSIGSRRLTEMPAGKTAPATLTKMIVPPFHWVVQSVDPDDWFSDPMPPYQPAYALSKYTQGNRVTALIDGIETFEEMYGELMRIDSANHFVYLAAWWLADDFPLVPGNANSTFRTICQDIDNNYGAKIRALVWSPVPPPIPSSVATQIEERWPNPSIVDRINQLAHKSGRAILDNHTREIDFYPGLEPCIKLWDLPLPPGLSLLVHPITSTGFIFWITRDPTKDLPEELSELITRLFTVKIRLPLGSHHQKVMVINNNGGLVAFCGGIDIKCNRLQEPRHFHPPSYFHFDCGEPGYHDVHCKVEGPATLDLLKTFRTRWNAHPLSPPGDALSGTPPARTPSTDHFVQIARTYPTGPGYVFAREGDRTLFSTLRRAILRARKFVYIEDQYLVSTEIRDALLMVIDRISHLTILITRDCDMLQARYRRHEFIAPLRQAGGSKVRVFWLRDLQGKPLYLHAKLMIIDDIFATIGSANVDRRGYTYDSEANVFVLDGQVEQGARKFARDLRIRLWAEHLGLNPAQLADPIGSANLWYIKSVWNLTVEYDENADVSEPSEICKDFYDQYADPDGSAP